MESHLKKSLVDSPSRKKLTPSKKAQKEQLVQNILTYDVLRMIFQYLSARDLYNVSSLCRAWREAANSESASRQAPECVFKRFEVFDDIELPEKYPPKEVGRDLRIKPSLGLVCEKVREEMEWTIQEKCYCRNLPINCNTIVLGGHEIVTDNKEFEKTFGVAACTFLPDMTNLAHDLLFVNSDTFEGVSDIDIHAHAITCLKQLLPTKGEKSKCIIMLTNQEGYHFMKIITKQLQKRYKPGTISLWGGVCLSLKFCTKVEPPYPTCSQTARWIAISLSSPTLQSWSIVLPRSCRTEQQIEEKLEQLGKSIQLKKHSLGFMFACVERLDRKEIEMKVFKKVFPKVPLVGLHGDGEYGLNTLSEKRESQLQHAYSTVFLVLTYQ